MTRLGNYTKHRRRVRNSPTHVIRQCRVCGCRDQHSCEVVVVREGVECVESCFWVAWDLCSACVKDESHCGVTVRVGG